MAVISPREEQVFQEITSQLTRPVRTTSALDSAFLLRRPILMLVWLLSLIGAFGGVDGRTAMVACAMSLAAATFAIWADFTASPESWTSGS